MMIEIGNWRQADLERDALTIEYRRQWYELKALERLESAVSRARNQFFTSSSALHAR